MRTAGLFIWATAFNFGVSTPLPDITCTTQQSRLFAVDQHARATPYKAIYEGICNTGSKATDSPNNTITARSKSLVFALTRPNSTESLDVLACEAHFEDIVQRCVSGGTVFANDIKYEVKVELRDHAARELSIGDDDIRTPLEDGSTPQSIAIKVRSTQSESTPRTSKSKKAKPRKGQKRPAACKNTPGTKMTSKKKPGRKHSNSRITPRDFFHSLVLRLTPRASSDYGSDPPEACLMEAETRAQEEELLKADRKLLEDFKKGPEGWGKTWFGIIEDQKGPNGFTEADVKRLVRHAHEKLKEAEPTHATIVAALWEKGMYIHLGSIPHNGGKATFAKECEENAKILWEKIKRRKPPKNYRNYAIYHAEDAALYQYEKVAPMDKYKTELYMTAYGQSSAQAEIEPQLPCGTDTDTDKRIALVKPSCAEVLQSLNILVL